MGGWARLFRKLYAELGKVWGEGGVVKILCYTMSTSPSSFYAQMNCLLQMRCSLKYILRRMFQLFLVRRSMSWMVCTE